MISEDSVRLAIAHLGHFGDTISFRSLSAEQTNKRRAVVPVNARAHAALEEGARGALTDFVIEWDERPVSSIKKAIRMAAKRAGVPCSPHVFRRTAGVWIAQADVPLQSHTSTRVTERTYAPIQSIFHEGRCGSAGVLTGSHLNVRFGWKGALGGLFAARVGAAGKITRHRQAITVRSPCKPS